MRIRSTRTLFAPTALVAALTIAALTGCSSGTSGGTPTPSASATEAAVSQKLPSDFPKADVPLIEGTVLVARGDAANGWSVTVRPEGKTGFADARAALRKAGYTQQAGATDNRAVFTDAKHTVAIGTPGLSVTYTVTAN